MKEKKKTYRFKSDIELALLAVPGLLWLLIFCYLPLVGNFIAFKDFKIFEGGFLHSLFKSAWVGFKNFSYLFASSETKMNCGIAMLQNCIKALCFFRIFYRGLLSVIFCKLF